MNDTRFKELLNLYLDHRLSPAEAAELEAEVLRDPARRRTYNGYCRMQRACHVLFENECEHAPQSLALARALGEVERKLAGGVPAQRSVAWLGWSGALAAACVVVVSVSVVLRDTPAGSGGTEAERIAALSTPTPAPRADASVAMPLAAAQPVAVAVAPEVAPVAAVASTTTEQQLWSRIAAQRWIDAEAESLMASRLVDDDRFVIQQAGDNGGVPSFQVRPGAFASTRGELTTYQFQR